MCKNCKAYNWEEACPQTFLVFSEKFVIWGLLSRLVPRPRPAFRHFEVHRFLFFFYMGEPGNEVKVTDFFFGVLVQCTKVVTLVCWLMSLPGAMFVLYCMLSIYSYCLPFKVTSKLHRVRLMKVISGNQPAASILEGQDPYVTLTTTK